MSRIVILAAVCLSSLGLPVIAQNMTLEQAQGLRKDADVAGKALEGLIQNVENQKVSKDATIARSALGRITDQLDKYIAEFKSSEGRPAPDDIYQGGRKYPPAAYVRIESFDVPVDASEVHVPV